MARSVTIQFLGNERDLVRATNAAGKSTSRLGTTLRRIGRSAVIGFGAAAIIAGKGLWEMGQMAADDEAQQVKLAGALKNATGATSDQVAAVEDWIKKTSLATGVTDDELRPALAKLAVVTKDVDKAQRLLAIGMDVAAGTGKSLESVTAALQKAQNGSVGGLARLGVATKNAAGETLSFEQIQKNLAKTFEGQSAKAAETTSGKFNRLKVALQEAGEEIGMKLIPYALRLSDWMLKTGIPAAQRLGTWFKEHLAPAIGDVVGWFRKADGGGGDLGGTMDDLSAFVDDVKRAWKGLSPLLKTAAEEYLPVLKAQIQQTAKNLRMMGDAAIWLWNNALGPMLKYATKHFSIFLRVVGETLSALGRAPGMEWLGKIGEKAIAASKSLDRISASVHDIPERKDVTINVTKVLRTVTGGGLGPVEDRAAPTGKPGKGSHLPTYSGRGMAGGGMRGGSQPIVIQFVTQGGKVIEQKLIQWSRETGRPIQVQTI